MQAAKQLINPPPFLAASLGPLCLFAWVFEVQLCLARCFVLHKGLLVFSRSPVIPPFSHVIVTMLLLSNPVPLPPFSSHVLSISSSSSDTAQHTRWK
ncbi:hypothetical protein V8C42DRAFT_272979 [Trichoderma barbatum]